MFQTKKLDSTTKTKNSYVNGYGSFDLKMAIRDQRFLLLLIIVVIAIVVGSLNPRFLGIQNIVAIFQQISVQGVLTMAMAILLLSGGIDLSIGNIMILAGIVMSKMLISGIEVGPTVLTGIAVAVGCGLLNGVIIAKSRCMPLIISLGMSGIYFGASLLLSEGKFMSFSQAFEGLRILRLFEVIPVTLFIFLFMVIIASIMVNRTKFGRRIVAIGGNEENAFLSGIKVDSYKIACYTISGLYCGIGSILYASRLDSITAAGGSGYELTALTGAIIGGITFDGGKGTILGAFFGVIFMGIITNAMTVLNINTYIQEIVSGAIIVAAIIISNYNNTRARI
ncbi:MAG TPA: ABC transporter permease [Clostridiales bacterium]|nr:ABC transporter permease [Clostridiales bacterium]